MNFAKCGLVNEIKKSPFTESRMGDKQVDWEKEMLIAVRAEVEDVGAWREGFRTHGDLFKSQGVSVAYMGATEGNSVIGVFETNDVDEFLRIFNDPTTAEAMANDKITGGVELFVLDETFTP
tara:strand:- start:413 stop:778 length:366 start_codon:yes stop_codon:yes gene_type:complete